MAMAIIEYHLLLVGKWSWRLMIIWWLSKGFSTAGDWYVIQQTWRESNRFEIEQGRLQYLGPEYMAT